MATVINTQPASESHVEERVKVLVSQFAEKVDRLGEAVAAMPFPIRVVRFPETVIKAVKE